MIKVDLTTGCWIWQGKPKGKGGYGQTFRNGKNMPAHRYVYEQVKGAIPDNHHLHHNETCPKLCVNPDHLTPLTPSEHRTKHPSLGRLTPTCSSCGLPWFICDAKKQAGQGCNH